MSSGWQSILSGGIVAIFAFVLAIVWDVVRFRREQRRQDKSVLKCAIAEINTLSGVLQNNLNLVETELGYLANEQGPLLNPLDPVAGGFWDLVKVHTPQALLNNADLLSKVTDAARRTEQVAQMIRSREAFRVNTPALSSFQQPMKQYDQLLKTFIPELLDALRDLKGLLQAVGR